MSESIDVSTITEYGLFNIKAGKLLYHDEDGDTQLGVAWSGNHAGKNNPDMCAIRDIGPLPPGWYEVGEPFVNPATGPFSMRLTPHEDNKMYGRDAFLIHGPSQDPEHYGQESKGCVVSPRPIRERFHQLHPHWLKVITGEEE